MTERAADGGGRWLGVGIALALAALGIGLGAAAWAAGPWAIAQALVPALLFLGGLSAGSLVLLLVHRLTGGQWGEDLRPPLLAAAAAVPLVALLAAPLLLGLAHVYPWAAEALSGAGDAPAHWYLNVPFFTARTLVILLLWLILAWSLGAYRPRPSSLPGIGASALGLLLMVLSLSLLGFDWVMSLDPEWYSAVFGLLVGTSQTLAAMALAVLWLGLTRWRDGARAARPSPDAGNLLLAILLLWGYLVLMQLVTVWIANLPQEIRWLVPRLQTDWRWLGLVASVLLPGLAVAMLLSRRVKTSPAALALAGGIALAGQALYALWLTLPTLHPAAPWLPPMDRTVLAAAGALWLAAFLLHLALSPSPRHMTASKPGQRTPSMPRASVPRGAAPAVTAQAARAGIPSPTPRVGPRRPPVRPPGRAASASNAGGEDSGQRKQEPGGITAGPVFKTLAGVGLVLLLATVVLLPWRRQAPAEPQPRLPEPRPALLPHPVANYAAYRSKQLKQLQSWGWVNRDRGIAHIPVNRAIEILAARTPSSTHPREAQR